MKACSGREGVSVDRHGGASRKLLITWSSTQRKERMGGERNREWDKAINTPRKAVSPKGSLTFPHNTTNQELRI